MRPFWFYSFSNITMSIDLQRYFIGFSFSSNYFFISVFCFSVVYAKKKQH
jgi:hypothetical protein